MFIPDNFPWTYARSRLNKGYKLRSIGWLGCFLPFWKKGTVTPLVIEALEYFSKAHRRDDTLLGYHTCALCNRHRDRAEFYIDLDGIRYIMPQMIIHYIKEHNYRPPKKFCKKLEKYYSENKTELLTSNPEMKCVLKEEEIYLIE